MFEINKYSCPEISVVIPTYNRDNLIQRLFECLKKQTFQNFECILVDDGSTDNTAEVCDSIARDDNRFIVKHIRHSGVSHARNLGLNLATGRYLTFIDSDDVVPDDYLEKLYYNINYFNSDIVVGSFRRVNHKTRKSDKITYPYEMRVYSLEEILPDFAVRQKETGVFGRCFAKIFPRSFISDIRFDETISLAEDFDFYLKLFQKIETIYFDNTCEYGYSDEANNSSSCIDDKDIDYITQLRIRLRYKKFLETKNSFDGTNKIVVSDQIRNYIYFSIYHCDICNFYSTFEKVRELYLLSDVDIENSPSFKGFVLKRVQKKQWKSLWTAMLIYKLGRKILKGH